MSAKYKTFKEYYDEDSEFRKKHLQRLNEKIECECGFMTARCNLSRHKKSHIHLQKMQKIQKNNKIQELKQEKEIIEDKISRLDKKKFKIDNQISKIKKNSA